MTTRDFTKEKTELEQLKESFETLKKNIFRSKSNVSAVDTLDVFSLKELEELLNYAAFQTQNETENPHELGENVILSMVLRKKIYSKKSNLR